MENRFQEALDFVKKSYPQGSKKWKQNVDTLQELVDNYSKPTYVLKANNISKKEIEDFINDISNNYIQPLPPFEIENIELEQYKKALDKLLDMCTEDVCCLSHNCPNNEYDFDEGICLGKCPTKDELKEYLLKEVQNGK